MNNDNHHKITTQIQELEMVNITQGLEEFATFMSFNSLSDNFRILSVTSIEEDIELEQAKQSAEVLDLDKHRTKKQTTNQQSLRKSLSFTSSQSH